MATTLRIATATRDVMMDAFDAQCNGGAAMLIRIYDGAQPATANTAITSQTLLAELTCSATAWGVSSNGVLTLNTVTDDSSANATGTATWARCLDEDGGDVIFDCEVGTSGAAINLNAVGIVETAPVSISSGTATLSGA